MIRLDWEESWLWRKWRKFERYFVLPLRYLRAHWRDCRELRQMCWACGQVDRFDFHVPDEIWKEVVPARWRDEVLCLRCFDRFAKNREVSYATSLQLLYFAGDKEPLVFRRTEF